MKRGQPRHPVPNALSCPGMSGWKKPMEERWEAPLPHICSGSSRRGAPRLFTCLRWRRRIQYASASSKAAEPAAMQIDKLYYGLRFAKKKRERRPRSEVDALHHSIGTRSSEEFQLDCLLGCPIGGRSRTRQPQEMVETIMVFTGIHRPSTP